MNRESYILTSQVNFFYFFCGLAGQPAPPRCWPARAAGYAGRANVGQRVENVSPPRVFYRGPARMARPTLPPLINSWYKIQISSQLHLFNEKLNNRILFFIKYI